MAMLLTVDDWVKEADNNRRKDGVAASIEVFEKAILVKKNQYIWIAYAKFASQHIDVKTAKNIYERAYEIYGDKITINQIYVKFLFEKRDFGRALEINNRGIELFPNRKTQFHLIVAEIHIIRGEFELAKEEYEKILKYSPNHSAAWKGIAGLEKKLALKEISDSDNRKDRIEKYIEFPPQHYQAGLSILSYFNTVLNQKYPDIQANVIIKQNDLRVNMIIETPDGKKEIIEKALTDYGLVVMGHLNPATLLSDAHHILLLENKIELANTELRMTNKILDSERLHNSARIFSLESEVNKLHNLVNAGLSQNTGLQKIINSHFEASDKSVVNSFELIDKLISQGAVDEDKENVFNALNTINTKQPSIISRISDLVVNGAISGASGNMLYSWIITFCNSLPK